MASADILRAAHSPLPWQVQLEGNRKPRVVCPDDEDPEWPWTVANCDIFAPDDKTGQGNAAFIVRACNAHYQMLEALKAAEACMAIVPPRTMKAEYLKTLSTVRAAIAAAEAEAER